MFIKDNREYRIRKAVTLANSTSKDNILDLGCGCDCCLLKFLLNGSKAKSYTGVDKNVKIAPYTIRWDLEKGLPPQIKDKKFDIVFMLEFIEHIENFKSLLIELHDVLNNNAKVVISTPHAFRLLYGDIFDGIGEDGAHIHCFKKSNMHNLARMTGYKIEKIVGTYIRFPPLIRRHIYIPTNQTLYSETLIYLLREIKSENWGEKYFTKEEEAIIQNRLKKLEHL